MGSAINSVVNAVENVVQDVGHLAGDALQLAGAVAPFAAIAFPPLGIATCATNLIAGSIGQAVTGALGDLIGCGMPKFIANEISQILKGVVDQFTKPGDPACQQHVNDTCHHTIGDFIKDFQKSLVENALEEMKNKSGGKGKSWFEAVAEALGKSLDAQAEKVKAASDQVQNSTGSDDQTQKSSDLTKLQTETQKMNFMMSAADNVIKTLGEALSTAARK